jgi:hypothetical protein
MYGSTAVARERLGKHVPAATDSHVTEERCFLRGPCRDVISKGQVCTSAQLSQSVKRRLECWCEMPASLVVSKLQFSPCKLFLLEVGG